jgi:acyl-CoA dehydrogenase
MSGEAEGATGLTPQPDLTSETRKDPLPIGGGLAGLVSKEDLQLMAEVDVFAARELASLGEREEREPSALGAIACETLKKLAGAGLLTHAVAPPVAGMPSLVRLCAVRERLARHHGLADLMFAMQGLGSAPIAIAGTPEQRERWLPEVIRGERIAAFAITETDAGSDVGGIATIASRDGGDYRITGRKTFISNAGIADLYVVFARTDATAGRKNITAFIVPADSPGLRLEKTLEVSAPHPIGTMVFADVRVPESARLGEHGDGFRIAMDTLSFFRPSVGAAAVGFATRALEEAVSRARTRVQFGKKIGEFQAMQFYIAEMATDLDAARLLVYRAARERDDRGGTAGLSSAMAKLAATELAQGIVDKAVQIHGGTGVLVGSVVERLYREVRALRIYEGTSEIQKLVIGREILGKM